MQKRFSLILVAILLIGLASFVGWRYWRSMQNTVPKSELELLTSKLDGVIELPSETPILAEVTDLAQLADQHFFDHAKNGDKVLIYLQSGRAVLYRPSIQKVIEAGPVQLVDICMKDPKATGCSRER